MQNRKYHILSTRELPAELLLEAKKKGMEIVVQSFIQVQPIFNDTLRQQVQPLFRQSLHAVFTSANAVTAVAAYKDPGPVQWQVYSLDGATGRELEISLQVKPEITATHAKILAEKIAAKGTISEVIFFCGNKRREELPSILKQHNIAVREVVVYETTEKPVAVDTAFDAILFFSPSAVNSFFAANTLPAHTVCFAIGPTTAAALEPVTNNRIIISASTSAESMVQAAIFYFNNN